MAPFDFERARSLIEDAESLPSGEDYELVAKRLAASLRQAMAALSYESREPSLAFEVAVPLPMRSNVDGQGGRGWWDRHRLVRQQHGLVGSAFLRHSRELMALKSSRHRGYTVRLTRIARDAGDDDNAASSVKGIRDAVAASLGVDDGAVAIRFLPVCQEVEVDLELPQVRIEIWRSQEICSACKQHVAPRRTEES